MKAFVFGSFGSFIFVYFAITGTGYYVDYFGRSKTNPFSMLKSVSINILNSTLKNKRRENEMTGFAMQS